MRLVIIHQAFVGPRESGGTRHYEFARYLQRQGHKVSIVASDISYLTGQRSTERSQLVTRQDVEGIQVLRAYTYAALHQSFFWRVVSFLSFMVTSVWAGLRAGPVDVVMGTSPPIFQAVSAWLVAFILRRPFLLEIRDLWPAFAIDMGVLKNPALIWLSERLENFLYARATHLLVNSPAYRDYLLDKHIPAAKITLIPNGVDPDMFQPDSDGQAQRIAFGLDGKFIATYAGALGMANDIETILRAAQRLQDQPAIHFLLVGDGKERRNLEKMAERLELNNVTFTGAQPKSAMPDVLAASDACIATLRDIPMFRTTYPNKVFDYMAAARPTLLAIDGVIREVIDAADGGIFVPPGDDEALAAAVLRLYHDPDAARAMGRRGRDYVVAHFNRHQHAEAFEVLLQEMVR
ncbi:MAG: glycosyltransferase WbuB [Anaerolineaceae bacterium]|nr:glycosyltransferase WbuB [Anaerolineaceae bacterium]